MQDCKAARHTLSKQRARPMLQKTARCGFCFLPWDSDSWSQRLSSLELSGDLSGCVSTCPLALVLQSESHSRCTTDPVTGATLQDSKDCPPPFHSPYRSPLRVPHSALIASCSLGLFQAFIFFFFLFPHKSASNTMATKSCLHLFSFHFRLSV